MKQLKNKSFFLLLVCLFHTTSSFRLLSTTSDRPHVQQVPVFFHSVVLANSELILYYNNPEFDRFEFKPYLNQAGTKYFLKGFALRRDGSRISEVTLINDRMPKFLYNADFHLSTYYLSKADIARYQASGSSLQMTPKRYRNTVYVQYRVSEAPGIHQLAFQSFNLDPSPPAPDYTSPADAQQESKSKKK